MTVEHGELVFIALGSNQGDREGHLHFALDELDDHPAITLIETSPVYETDPFGMVDQPSFLNMVVVCRSGLSPEELLDVTQAIESFGGRKRMKRWGPRTIDLDILCFGHHEIKTQRLVIPHPRMMERAFVLIPLLDVAAIDPDLDIQQIKKAIEACGERDGVKLYKSNLRG